MRHTERKVARFVPALLGVMALMSMCEGVMSASWTNTGDLNTPRESRGFDELRGFMSHAFETAGRGVAETWPTWAPALSIDHVWSSGSGSNRNGVKFWELAGNRDGQVQRNNGECDVMGRVEHWSDGAERRDDGKRGCQRERSG